MRFALVVEYDGTDFSGSQFQTNTRTVQGALEEAATTIFGDGIDRIRLASRTDAGVHATGQVATLDCDTGMGDDEVRRAMNGNLAPDVCVKRVVSVDASFDPRRDAIAREYRYVICDDATPSPLRRRYEYHVHRPLDTDAMNDAAELFIGVNDFKSFAAALADEGSTLRRVDLSIVERRDDGRIVFDIRARSFVRQQIRRMVAVLIAVGDGSRTINTVQDLIVNPRRNGATQNAPAHGLTLVSVQYEPGVLAKS